MWTRGLACLLIAIGTGTMGMATAQARVGAVAVQWGEVEAVVVGPMSDDAKLKALSPGQTVRDARFTRITDQIDARLCGRFGLTAWLTAGPGETLPKRVTAVVLHPTLTRPDGESSAEDSFYTPVIQGEVGAFFSFESRWEMEPGTWTFEFRNGDAVLVSKSFTVTRSGEAPRATCEGPPTS